MDIEMEINTDPIVSMNIINEDGSIGMDVNTDGGTIDHNKLINRNLDDQHPISAITGLQEALDNAGVTQIYKGQNEPTSEDILIWIDTSGVTPSTDIQFITKDGLDFITSDNKNFILKEEY